MRNADFVRLHASGQSSRNLFSMASAPGASLSSAAASAMPESGFRALESLFESRGVVPVSVFDPEYPDALKALPRHPFLLYVRGTLPEAPSLSVVGSRKPTPYGLSVTSAFVSDFVRNGFAVVSGGAFGIDVAAHRAAIDSGGVTLAFVGTGIDLDYPRQHGRLFEEIVAKGGAVVSPFPPGALPLRQHFPIRNALVAAFSLGTLVVEAAEGSGSLITARNALEFGKEVFAVPWDVGRPSSAGSNALIREGSAKCVVSPADVYADLGWVSTCPERTSQSPLPSAWKLSALAESVRAELRRVGASEPERLASELSENVSSVVSALAELEIAGLANSDLFWSYRLA